MSTLPNLPADPSDPFGRPKTVHGELRDSSDVVLSTGDVFFYAPPDGVTFHPSEPDANYEELSGAVALVLPNHDRVPLTDGRVCRSSSGVHLHFGGRKTV